MTNSSNKGSSENEAKMKEEGLKKKLTENNLKLLEKLFERNSENCQREVDLAEELERILEEEKKVMLGELAAINNRLVVPQVQSQPDSQDSQVIVAERLTPSFPPEVFMCIASHLSAKDQLTLRSLNKDIRSAIPKLLRLNFKYFRESFDKLVKGLIKEPKLISQIPVHFTLDPKEVEINSYGVIELVRGILDGRYSYGNKFAAIHAILGPSLRVAVPEILRRSHQHPKFKLLTLDMAAFANYTEAIQFLLSGNENAALPQTDFETALFASSQCGYDEIVQILLQDPRVDPAWNHNFSIALAAQQGRTATVQILLQDPRVSPEADDNFAIRFAAERGHVGVVKLLLADARVDWKAQNFRALRSAHQHGHCETSKILLDHFVAHPGEREREGDILYTLAEKLELVKKIQAKC